MKKEELLNSISEKKYCKDFNSLINERSRENVLNCAIDELLKQVNDVDTSHDKALNLADVSNRRELLLDFMTYVSPEAYATHSKAELADNYLSSNSC